MADFERFAYFNGRLVPRQEAMVSVDTPAFRYGASVFEGLRAYWNPDHGELYVFRLQEHALRLHQSMRVMRLEPLFSPDECAAQILAALQGLEVRQDVHVRQTVFLDGNGPVWAKGPVGHVVTVNPSGRPEGFETGIRSCVSSWARISDQSLPPRIKCAANYQNSRLAAMEAKLNGYDAPILLGVGGKVAESWGACAMLVRGEMLVTPSKTSGILESVTRDAVLTLAGDLGVVSEEREVDRTELYMGSELFLCGSAFEITPVVSIDGLPVGTGERGALTKRLQQAYLAAARGEEPKYRRWCQPVFGHR